MVKRRDLPSLVHLLPTFQQDWGVSHDADVYNIIHREDWLRVSHSNLLLSEVLRGLKGLQFVKIRFT